MKYLLLAIIFFFLGFFSAKDPLIEEINEEEGEY